MNVGRGQTITFRVSVTDRTFKNYAVTIGSGTDTATVTDFGINAADGVWKTVAVNEGLATCYYYEIDPYRVIPGEGYLPREIIVDTFANGVTGSFVLPVVWTTEFVISYEGSAITVVEGYVVGMGDQPVSFAVEVKQRPANAYTVMFSDENGNAVLDENGEAILGNNEGAGTYNFRIHQEDPFVFGADNLPKYAHLSAPNDSVTVPIEWKIESNTFNVAGGTSVVHGYLASEGVGHHITLTVVTDVWTFVRIARPVDTRGTDDYTQWEYRDMSPIRFTFVSLINENGYFEMTDRAFRATFRVTDGNGGYSYKEKFFVPEAYATDSDLKIYFNEDAIRQAAQSTSKVNSSSFYLGDTDKVRMHVTGNITYLVEAPIIETDSVVYEYNTSGGRQYLPYILIDPLNPSLPQKAYSYTNWSLDVLVEWSITSTAEFGTVNLSNYLVGGILRGKNFAFTLKDADGANVTDQSGNAITQVVPVQFLFLDRSVEAGEETTRVSAGKEVKSTVSLTFKDTFDAYTYSGKPNPYGSYNDVIDALNAAVSIYGSTRTVEIVYEITENGEKAFKEFVTGGNVYTKDIFGDAPIVWQEER